MIARRALTEPKAALAGMVLEVSFARFMSSMVTFNVDWMLSISFRRDFEVMVEIHG